MSFLVGQPEHSSKHTNPWVGVVKGTIGIGDAIPFEGAASRGNKDSRYWGEDHDVAGWCRAGCGSLRWVASACYMTRRMYFIDVA